RKGNHVARETVHSDVSIDELALERRRHPVAVFDREDVRVDALVAGASVRVRSRDSIREIGWRRAAADYQSREHNPRLQAHRHVTISLAKPMIDRSALAFVGFTALGIAAAQSDVPWSTGARSPRIDSIQRAVASGDAAAVARFWTDLATQHAPII